MNCGALPDEFDAKLFINDRVDVALAAGADGVHLGQQSMSSQAVRKMAGNKLLIGVSTHTVEEAKVAEAGGADFINFGPVFFTPSKAEFGEAVGLVSFKKAAASVNLPVFALGGVKSGNIEHLLNCGAHGVSMISAIFSAEDIRKAAETIIGETN